MNQSDADRQSPDPLLQRARDYSYDKLEYGSELAHLISLDLGLFCQVSFFHQPADFEEITAVGHRLSLADADAALVEAMTRRLMDSGPFGFIVEDDLDIRRDHGPSDGVNYVGNRVVRRREVKVVGDVADAVRTARADASPLALNAYLYRLETPLYASVGSDLQRGDLLRIAQGTFGYLTHYWDEEAFLLLERTEFSN